MQPSDQPRKIYRAKRLDERARLTRDGRGTDAAWRTARVLSEFCLPWTRSEPPATDFRALWNDEFFFFRFDVVDADIVLSEGADAMEKVVGSDRVEIFFSTGPTLAPYYGVEIDPRGEVLSYEARYHRQMNWAWSCDGLVARSSLLDWGYLVEGSIPISTFERLGCLHQDDAGRYLIAGLYRAEFSHGSEPAEVVEDWISWVDPEVESPDFHVPSSFGAIRFED